MNCDLCGDRIPFDALAYAVRPSRRGKATEGYWMCSLACLTNWANERARS